MSGRRTDSFLHYSSVPDIVNVVCVVLMAREVLRLEAPSTQVAPWRFVWPLSRLHFVRPRAQCTRVIQGQIHLGRLLAIFALTHGPLGARGSDHR